MAISGIEILMQLGLLGEANFKATKVPNGLGVTSACKSDC